MIDDKIMEDFRINDEDLKAFNEELITYLLDIGVIEEVEKF